MLEIIYNERPFLINMSGFSSICLFCFYKELPNKLSCYFEIDVWKNKNFKCVGYKLIFFPN